MNVWCHLPTIFRQRFALLIAGLITLCVALTTTLFFALSSDAAPGVNEQLSFQGRLLRPEGGIVPDGYYNIQFKIYENGTGAATGNPDGTLKWTESRVNNGGTNGVQVKNGYFSVMLGSVTPFGSSIDWNQDTLWLSMNVAGTASTCTSFGSGSCTADGEMLPMKRISSVPQAINSKQLGGKTADNFIQLAQGVQNDASVNTTSININKTGGGRFIQLQNTGVDVFTVNNSGNITFGSGSNHNIDIADSSAGTTGRNLTIAGGGGGTGTTNGGNLILQGGSNGTTAGLSGSVIIDAGTKVGAGTGGTVEIGTTNASGIVLGANVGVAAGKSLTLAGGITSTRPSNPTEGTLYFDTSTKQLLVFSNGKWQADRSTASKIVAATDSPQTAKDAADYVADGTNDHIEINAALTAAAGGKVVLLNGTYTVGAAISVPNNTTLTGSGTGTTIQLANFGATTTNINAVTNTDTTTGTGVTIRDLSINGRKSLNTAGTQNGIYLDNMGDSGAAGRNGAIVTGVNVYDMRTSGISLSNADSGNFSENTVRNNGTNGITTASSLNNVISNNTALGNGSTGISIGTSSTANTVTGNVSRENTTSGITVTSSSGNTISGNMAQDSSIGIYLNAASNNMVTGNTARFNTINISILTSNSNTISGNQLPSSGGNSANNSINLNNSDDNTISGNTITDTSCTTTCYAINITNSSSDINQISNNSLGNGIINDLGTGTIYANQIDQDGRLINKSTGGVSVQSGSNNPDAFRVQNAGGVSALQVNTSTNSVLVAGAIDTTAAAGLTLGSANATSITIGKSTSNITTTLLGNTIIKPTTGNDSTTSFQLQRANGTAMLVADSSGQTITFGDPASANKTVISTATGQITKYGTARNVKKIALSAEYLNSVLDAGTGANNTGTMTSSIDLTNRMNYYKWTTTQGSNQSYDVVTQIPLPTDFDGWESPNPLTISTYTSNTTNGTILLEVRDSAGSVRCDFVSVTPVSTGTWTANNSACTMSTGTYTAGDYITVRIRMQSPNGGDVRIGNINLNYLSKH